MPDNALGMVVLIIAFFATIVLHALTLEQWYHTIQTYLYVIINLGTNISMSEAKHFLMLFAPTDEGVWYPMTGIKDLPKKYRRQVLLDSAKRIYAERGYQFGIDIDNNRYENDQDAASDEYCSGRDMLYSLSGFSDLVAMLCKMAKGDRTITKDDIEVIDNFFINIFNLSHDERKKAIDIFRNTKETDTPFEVYAREFHRKHKDKKELLEAVLDLLIRVAFADGELSAEEEILLNQAATIFKVDLTQYQEYQSTYNEKETTSTTDRKERHYAKVLGLQDDITPDKVKSSYRKLAVQYHPDKVSHLGSKIREVAEIEMKKFNEAYEYFQKKYRQ